LTDDERASRLAVVKKLKGFSQKVRRANILLKSDIDGPNWTDQDIADAFFCSRQCVENVRKRLVTEGFDRDRHTGDTSNVVETVSQH
jgi:predicted transcriptional regulator